MNPNHRILFAGDPHGNFRPVVEAVRRYRPEAVVLLGDYDLERPLEHYLDEIIGLTEIWWIAGNHDFQSPGKHSNLFRSALGDYCLHLRVKEVAGLRVAGLGGIFLGRVWYPPAQPKWINKRHFLNSQKPEPGFQELSLKYQSAIWYDEFEALKTLRADVLVTHEAPSSHRYGFAAIGELASAMGARHIFHGHLHENYSATIRKNIRVVGVADQMVADFGGNLVSVADLVT